MRLRFETKVIEYIKYGYSEEDARILASNELGMEVEDDEEE